MPSSGEPLPFVGLGSWITFNVGDDPVARAACAEVMRAFLEGAGVMIDSTPMYGSSQPVIGRGLAQLPGALARVFSAEKAWTAGGDRSAAQVEVSRRHRGVPRFGAWTFRTPSGSTCDDPAAAWSAWLCDRDVAQCC